VTLNIYKIKTSSNKYAIFKTILFQDDQEFIIVYANTKLSTSFINEFLLSKDNLYERLDIVSLVIVQDIVDKKIIDKRMHLFIYVIGVNEVVLEARSYVTKDIKTSIILDNDVLEMSKNKISLHLHSKRMQIDSV